MLGISSHYTSTLSVQVVILTLASAAICGTIPRRINERRSPEFSREHLRGRAAEDLRFAMPEKKIRVLIAKPGLDGHDRGAKIIARALRDAGMEVIYTGLRPPPEMIAPAAIQEDVDVIGLSILPGAHNTICPQMMKLLYEKGMEDVVVLLGGIIPEPDIVKLKNSGIAEVFLPGSSTQDIVEFIQKRLASATL